MMTTANNVMVGVKGYGRRGAGCGCPKGNALWGVGGSLWLLFFLCTQTNSAQSQVTNSFTEPYEVLEIAAAEAGILADLPIRQGEVVQAGQVLAVLDTDVLAAALELAKFRAASTARIEAAAVEVRLKKTQLDKLALILAGGHASTNEIERAKAEHEAALAAQKLAEEEVAQQRLEVKQIEAQMERRRVRSPVAGVITKLHKRRGEYLAASDPQVATIVQLQSLRVKFYVTTTIAAQLQPGATVQVELVEHGTCPALVDFISPVTDADSGTVRIELLLDNAAGKFRSGIPCRLLDVGE